MHERRRQLSNRRRLPLGRRAIVPNGILPRLHFHLTNGLCSQLCESIEDTMKQQYAIYPAEQNLDIDALISSAHEASGLLKALAHEARLLILCLLVETEKSVTEIEDLLKLRQPAVSQQLARLRADGLVQTRRDGKNIFYSLARPEVRAIIGVLHQAFCEQPPPRALALLLHST